MYQVYKFWHFQYFLCCRCKFQCNYVYLLLCQGLSQCFQIIIFLYLYKYSLILLKMRKLVQFCKYTLYISSITLSYHECSRIRFSDSFLVVRGEIIYSSVLFRNLQSLSFLSEQKLIFDEMNIKLHVFRSMSILNQLLYLKMKLQKDQLQRIFFQILKKQQHFLKIIIEQIVLWKICLNSDLTICL